MYYSGDTSRIIPNTISHKLSLFLFSNLLRTGGLLSLPGQKKFRFFLMVQASFLTYLVLLFLHFVLLSPVSRGVDAGFMLLFLFQILQTYVVKMKLVIFCLLWYLDVMISSVVNPCATLLCERFATLVYLVHC